MITEIIDTFSPTEQPPPNCLNCFQPYQFHDLCQSACPGSLWQRPRCAGWWDEVAPSTAPFRDQAEDPGSRHFVTPSEHKDATATQHSHLQHSLSDRIQCKWLRVSKSQIKRVPEVKHAARPFVQPTPGPRRGGSPPLLPSLKLSFEPQSGF